MQLIGIKTLLWLFQIDADVETLQFMSCTSRGQFAPLTAALGGIVAQEALKALTGKFTPLQQWVGNKKDGRFGPNLVNLGKPFVESCEWYGKST
jgi:hypothetical protein